MSDHFAIARAFSLIIGWCLCVKTWKSNANRTWQNALSQGDVIFPYHSRLPFFHLHIPSSLKLVITHIRRIWHTALLGFGDETCTRPFQVTNSQTFNLYIGLGERGCCCYIGKYGWCSQLHFFLIPPLMGGTIISTLSSTFCDNNVYWYTVC